MQSGDLIECPDGTRLIVDCYHPTAKIYVAYDAEDQRQEISFDLPCTVISNPRAAWPFLGHPNISGHHGVLTVSIPGRQRTLVKLVDWVYRGSSLYLNPALRLHLAEVVLVTFRDNITVSYSISRFFSNVAAKLVLVAKMREVPSPKTIFDHLLEDEED